jgi:arylsulfatase A-like enzyme
MAQLPDPHALAGTDECPNLVFLFNDHQIYYRHGWDAGPRPLRPRFEAFAAQGIHFTRAYTACALCGPARRTVLTGLYPHAHREIQNDVDAPYAHEVYLDALNAAGYRNYYYGKWHAGPGTALDHHCDGFSYPGYGNPYIRPAYRAYLRELGLGPAEHLIERGFLPQFASQEGKLYRCEREHCNESASGLTVTPKETHEAFFLAHLACEKLAELAREGGPPFALRVDFWGPHQPYFPTVEYAALYDPEDIPPYGNFHDDLMHKPEIYANNGNHYLSRAGKLILPSALPWSEWQKVIARAYAHVTMVDAAGGLILDALDALGLANSTLVIWTADHGDGLACHGGHWDKRSYMSEEVMRVPLAIRWPGVIPPGQQSNRLVSNLDLAPTLLQAAGGAFRGPIHGASLLPLCTGECSVWREDLMCETHGHLEHHVGRGIVTDRYKYIANCGQMDELYDLQEDPYEMANLIDDPADKAVREDLQARLARWQRKTHDPQSCARPPEKGMT